MCQINCMTVAIRGVVLRSKGTFYYLFLVVRSNIDYFDLFFAAASI